MLRQQYISENKIGILEAQKSKSVRFVEDIHELYKIACCMITKPGGITLTEALSVQLPLIIIKPVPGQEKENARYFEKRCSNNSQQYLSNYKQRY